MSPQKARKPAQAVSATANNGNCKAPVIVQSFKSIALFLVVSSEAICWHSSVPNLGYPALAVLANIPRLQDP